MFLSSSRTSVVITVTVSEIFIFYFFCRSTEPNLSSELTEVYEQLENIEADKAPARASIILSGLGFSPEMQGRPTRTFSGGWRMRLALARALFSKYVTFTLEEVN